MFKSFLLIGFILFVTGCAPTGKSYFKSEYNNATYFNESCYGSSGAPSILFFEFNGIYLSTEIDQSNNKLKIGIHVPKNQTAQLLSNKIQIESFINNSQKNKVHSLIPTKREEEYSSMPYIFHTKDSFGKINYFGELQGETRTIKFTLGSDKTAYKWYLYTTDINLIDVQKGTIEFPKIKINGKVFQGPKINFEESFHVYIASINC